MKCYACGQRVTIGTPVYTSDDDQQEQLVGPDCYLHAKDAGKQGWQPPKGGPRLYASRADAAAAGRREEALADAKAHPDAATIEWWAAGGDGKYQGFASEDQGPLEYWDCLLVEEERQEIRAAHAAALRLACR